MLPDQLQVHRGVNPALAAAQIAWVGPLLGFSIAQPYGGKLADHFGGGRITMICFGAMTVAATILVATRNDRRRTHNHKIETPQLAAFIAGFTVLFLISGIANGSVYKIIPTVFEHWRARTRGLTPWRKVIWSRKMSGALIGIAGAVGALGGVGINLVLRSSYKAHQSATAAFWVFLGFYVLAGIVTWWFYARREIVLHTHDTRTTDTIVAVPA